MLNFYRERYTSNAPFILLSEEIFYNRSPALNEEIALATVSFARHCQQSPDEMNFVLGGWEDW